MEDYLKNVQSSMDKQKVRFQKGLGADFAFLILVLLLYFVNIYSYFNTNLKQNPEPVRLLIFMALWFFTGWNVYAILKNALGLWGINKTEEMIPDIRKVKSAAMDVPTWSFFHGFFYDVIDKNFSLYVAPLGFHLKKKQENLLSLNLRYLFWDFLILSTGIGMFVSQVIYYNGADFGHWETTFGLILMIVSIMLVLGYLLPRQFIINKQIKLNDMKKISESDYFDQYKYFYIEKVLTKFWNK